MVTAVVGTRQAILQTFSNFISSLGRSDSIELTHLLSPLLRLASHRVQSARDEKDMDLCPFVQGLFSKIFSNQ